MKKIVSLLIVMVVLASCGESIEFNNESVIQGVKDNSAWKATTATATISPTTLTIVGVNDKQTLTLSVPLPSHVVDPLQENTFITYVLGTSVNKKATFTIQNADGIVIYETGISEEDGQIVISEFNSSTVSGSFRFNAYNTDEDADEDDLVNFQEGVVYKVPLTKVLQ